MNLGINIAIKQVATFDYGDKLENPVKKIKFYTKHNSKQAFLLDEEEVLQFTTVLPGFTFC